MGTVFDVNAGAVVKYSAKLDRISKRALPRVVRNTLNDMARHTKQKTLISETNKEFTNRNKTFFKRFSRFEPAKMGNINDMQSTVGMVDNDRGKRDQAGRNLKEQQVGGRIGGRTLVPVDQARIRGKNERNIRKINRLDKIKVRFDTKQARTTKPKQRLIQSSIYALKKYGQEAVIKHTRSTGKTFLLRVRRGGKDIKTRDFNIGVEFLYSVKKGRHIRIDEPVPFTQNAALITQKQLANRLFIKHAKDRFRREGLRIR